MKTTHCFNGGWNPRAYILCGYLESNERPKKLVLCGFLSRKLAASSIMAGQRTPPGHVPPPEMAGLIKGLLTIDFP